jgi:hypothetical protein
LIVVRAGLSGNAKVRVWVPAEGAEHQPSECSSRDRCGDVAGDLGDGAGEQREPPTAEAGLDGGEPGHAAPVAGIRGATPGQRRVVALDGSDMSARLLAGDRLVAWVTSGDAGFCEPYPGAVGGALAAGRARR